ncbi:hypothetical protein BCR43DRAFT_509272 [Syncephalastrum racemosum]|uniref:Uncharacterized protein n=1 Tax=Syncephalastrum racemosum TaxID=13706 RepID=A0A1X2H065_SYNRA|nr:hypothetical protein BCR43DRAFT_509272 [Syncephalastrum racemosum]
MGPLCHALVRLTLFVQLEQAMWFGVMFLTNAFVIARHDYLRCHYCRQGIIVFCFLSDKTESCWLHLTPEKDRIVEKPALDDAAVQNKDNEMGHIIESLRCHHSISTQLRKS